MTRYPHVKDRRPITPAEARQGMEAVRQWPEKDRLEIFQLPDNEAGIVLLLAGELDAAPVVPAGAGPGNVYPGSGEAVPGSNPAPGGTTPVPYDPSTSEIPY